MTERTSRIDLTDLPSARLALTAACQNVAGLGAPWEARQMKDGAGFEVLNEAGLVLGVVRIRRVGKKGAKLEW